MAVSLSILPAITGLGLPEVGWGWLPGYTAAAVVTALGTTGVGLWLVRLAGSGARLDAARNVLAWSQIVAILVLFYGGQLMIRDATGDLEMFAARPPAWVAMLPTAWLADALLGRPDGALRGGAVAVGALLLLGTAVVALARAWGVPRAPTTRRGRKASPIDGWWSMGLRRPGERVAFWLASTALRRDGELRGRALPPLAMAVAGAFLGLATDQFADPAQGAGAVGVLSVAVPVLLASAVPSVMLARRASRYHYAAWVLQTSPVPPQAWRGGVRKAVQRWVFGPVVLGLTVAAGAWWGAWLAALAYGLATWALVDAALRVASVDVLDAVPLSRPPVRGGTLGGAVPVVLGVATAASIAGGLWFFAAPLTGPWGPVALMGAVALGADRGWGRRG